jgi:hypothetical protein
VTARHWSDALVPLGACTEAVSWARTQPDYETAWAACERGDWLIWLADRLREDRRTIVRAACACARLALRYVPAGDDRPLRAIEAAEGWCDGNVTLEIVVPAAAAAYAAYYYAAATASAAAAYAARDPHSVAATVRAHIQRPDLDKVRDAMKDPR